MVDVVVMNGDEFRGGGWRNTVITDTSSTDIPFKLLTLQFTHGKGSNYGGVNLDLEIEASLTDPSSRKAYWKGTYDTRPRKTPFRNSTYDNAFLTEMLQMMLDDMAKMEVLKIDK